MRIRICIHPDATVNRALMLAAASRLCREGFGSLVDYHDLAAGHGEGPLLLLDGDHRQVDRQARTEAGISADFYLVVTDLGLETDEARGFTDADVQLLMDGIQAVCTVTKGPTPGHHCPCR